MRKVVVVVSSVLVLVGLWWLNVYLIADQMFSSGGRGIGELRMPQKAKAGEAIEVYVNVFVTAQARGKRKPLTERYTSVVLRYQLGDGPPHTLYPSGRMPKEDGNGAYYQFIIPPYSKGELEVEASWVLDGKAKSLRGRVELS